MKTKTINLTLLILILFSNLYSNKLTANTNKVLGFTVAGLTAWLIGEKIHKYYINKELTKYKNDTFSEELIKNTETYLNNLNSTLRIYSIPANNQNIESLASFKENININAQISILEENYKKNCNFLAELKTKTITWTQKNQPIYIKKAEKQIKNLKIWDPILKNSIEFAKINKNTKELEVLAQNLNSEYALEISSLKSNNHIYNIDKRILEKFSGAQYIFPRINYIEKLNNSIKKLEILINLSKSDYLKYKDILGNSKVNFIDNQNLLLYKLKEINKIVSLSKDYIYEKNKKPLFDREQDLIKIQIKEREAKVKAVAEEQKLKLQRELNYAKHLENQKRDQKVRYKEAKLELARIKNGSILLEQEKKWLAKNNTIKKDYENKITKLNADISNYKKEIDKLNIEIKNKSNSISKLQEKIKNLEAKLSNYENYFKPSAPPAE